MLTLAGNSVAARIKRRFSGVLLLVLSGLPGMATSDAAAIQPLSDQNSGVVIRRTTDGIPHIRAQNWRDLGKGIGYVQAQDALCTLAEAYVTFEGRRSFYFGADLQPVRNSTFGRSKNIDLDFFFRAFADDTVVAGYRHQQPAELGELVKGFVAGYNQHLTDARAGRLREAMRSCLKEPWVREIREEDIYRRMYAGQVAAGYARFITEMSRAQPSADVLTASGNTEKLRAKLALPIGDQAGLGSNALAFGRQATGEEEAVLLGNPHWYWGGPDRFYQMHLTIPGALNVAGVAFLGVPVVMIGFNEHVAWSHTVSAARRFGLFDLTLDAGNATRYVVDGRSEAMHKRQVVIDVRDTRGKPQQISRTFYSTRFGPVVNLGEHDAAFGWSRTHAIAIRDINAENFRIFGNFLHWNQAKSLDEFIAVQMRDAAMPWVNTVAIGRGDGRVWYGDIGAVPNAPDDLRESCSTTRTKGFARIDPATPFLDGSRSACNWRTDVAAVQPGSISALRLPGLVRRDYVANMNDSYWLSNFYQPLEGFPSLLGGEREPLTVRGRLGHRIALEILQKPSASAGELSRRVMQAVLSPRAYSAELFKTDMLETACRQPEVEMNTAASAHRAGQGGSDEHKTVNVKNACQILRQWPNRADADDRGALLWEAFWAQLRRIPAAELYKIPFSRAAPLDTPRAPVSNRRIAEALAAAVMQLESRGIAPDASVGSQRFVESGGQKLPMYGGCPAAGYFTVACNQDGGDQLGPDSMANSYLQMVYFGSAGVEARTLLAHGLDESAVMLSGQGMQPVERYAHKSWLHFPFYEKDIEQDPGLSQTVLQSVSR